ncbi:MAG: threonylcarbamoyl-AMP synthase [Gemmatimonadaceae bacterium]|nr:threonylcarbamoyl-AMP synthase [Gemmatimonadaceae bacterium]
MDREARALPFWSDDEVAAGVDRAVRHVQEGGVLAYPTETVYGFGGAIDTDAVARLVELKRRPPAKPFLLLVDSSEMIARLGLHLTRSASMLAARHWPGPLTLVLPGGDRRVPTRLRGPEGGVAVRWTSHPALQRLIGALGDPLTSTSANLPGHPAAMAASEVLQQWAAAIGRGTMLVLDGGRLAPSAPSTVVDCTARVPRVIRPGAISAAVLRESTPDLVGDH